MKITFLWENLQPKIVFQPNAAVKKAKIFCDFQKLIGYRPIWTFHPGTLQPSFKSA